MTADLIVGCLADAEGPLSFDHEVRLLDDPVPYLFGNQNHLKCLHRRDEVLLVLLVGGDLGGKLLNRETLHHDVLSFMKHKRFALHTALRRCAGRNVC